MVAMLEVWLMMFFFLGVSLTLDSRIPYTWGFTPGLTSLGSIHVQRSPWLVCSESCVCHSSSAVLALTQAIMEKQAGGLCASPSVVHKPRGL